MCAGRTVAHEVKPVRLIQSLCAVCTYAQPTEL